MNYLGKGNHTISELEQIIEQQSKIIFDLKHANVKYDQYLQRERIATAAMAGIISCSEYDPSVLNFDLIGQVSLKAADALINALKNK